jgi:hypothetical protein
MPRVYAGNNDPIDYCQQHFPDQAAAQQLHGVQLTGEGPDGRGDCFEHDAAHPDYEGLGYSCATCGVELTADDDLSQE